MAHQDVEAQVDAYLDGELAASDAARLEAHLAGCASCGRFRDDRLALRQALVVALPKLEAPAALRNRVRAALRDQAAAQPARRPARSGAWRWMALAAALAGVAVGSWRLAVVHGLKNARALARAMVDLGVVGGGKGGSKSGR
jgi:anti-sigma factor RsiW